MNVEPKDARRFWEKVSLDAPDVCWLWLGCRFAGKQYGVFRYQYKNWRAHRFAYAITHGDIPEGLLVCHACDNPACCNPDHLLLGTNANNSEDMVTRGRSLKGIDIVPPERRARGDKSGARLHPERMPRGERHGHSKLSDDIVRSIRLRHAAGESQQSIASSIGIHQTAVSRVVLRQTWKHIP